MLVSCSNFRLREAVSFLKHPVVPIFQCCSAAPLASKCISHAVDSRERPGSNRPLCRADKISLDGHRARHVTNVAYQSSPACSFGKTISIPAADYDTGSKALETRKSHLATTFPFSFLLWSFRCTLLPVICKFFRRAFAVVYRGIVCEAWEQAPSGLAFSPAHLQVTRPPLKGHLKLA